MAFFSHVHSSEFWNPDDRRFFQLILICLIYTCNIKVKKSMDFLDWVGKTWNKLWGVYIKSYHCKAVDSLVCAPSENTKNLGERSNKCRASQSM